MKTFPLTRRTEYLVLFVLLSGMALLYNFPQVFGLGPYSFHMWRQTDCLSLTQGYYDNGLDFFQPCMNNQEGGTGKAVSEFPVLYYVNAALWNVFGKSESLYRVLITCLSITGLFFLFRLARVLLDSFFWALMVALFLFTSPIYVFYTNNFLGNVPAISFLIAGWYALYVFYDTGNNKAFALSMLCLTMAGLLRLTMLYTYTFIYLAFLIEFMGWGTFGKAGQRLFYNRILQGVLLALPLLIIAAWTAYASYYNRINGTEVIFLMHILPMWEIEWGRCMDIARQCLDLWAIDIWLSTGGLLIASLVWLFLMRHLKKLKPLVRLAVLSLPFFLLVYLMLFFQNLHEHDYYLLEVLPFGLTVVLAFLLLLKNNYQNLLESRSLKYLTVILLMISTIYCTARYRIRYGVQDDVLVHALGFVYSKDYYNFLSWFHFDYQAKLKAYEHLGEELDKLGIGKNDLVISIPDASPNVTLYMMERKGYTSYKWGNDYPGLIRWGKQRGVKYLIVNNEETATLLQDQKLTGSPMAQFKNITIYDLRSSP